MKSVTYLCIPLAVLLAPIEGVHSGQVNASSSESVLEEQHSQTLEFRGESSARSPLNSHENERKVSRHYPTPKLDPITLYHNDFGDPVVDLAAVEKSSSLLGGKVTARSQNKEFVFLSVDPKIQNYTQELINQVNAPHAVAVVMDPKTGKVLALAQRSKELQNMFAHYGFPAASLFKIITAAAGIEHSNISPSTIFRFRGGTYTLQPWNYKPDPKRDTRHMSLAEAMGRSCNPVFARVALEHLSPSLLKDYADAFGFNTKIAPSLALPKSTAEIPEQDYQFSRTAAGFGKVRITPVHAAAIMAGIANGGVMPRPRAIEEVVSSDGEVTFRSSPESLGKMVEPQTAEALMDMLEYTTTMGTSKREFVRNNKKVFPQMSVVGKTGTLSGSNPKGVHNWFIGAAPKSNPELIVATLVVYPGSVSTRASRIARQIMQEYFKS